MSYRRVEIPGHWADDAACLRLDGQAKRDFFPPTAEDGIPTGKASRAQRIHGTARALKVCASCPVRQQCKEWAYRNRLDAEFDGILGGETPHQRKNNRLGRRTIGNETAA